MRNGGLLVGDANNTKHNSSVIAASITHSFPKQTQLTARVHFQAFTTPSLLALSSILPWPVSAASSAVMESAWQASYMRSRLPRSAAASSRVCGHEGDMGKVQGTITWSCMAWHDCKNDMFAGDITAKTPSADVFSSRALRGTT